MEEANLNNALKIFIIEAVKVHMVLGAVSTALNNQFSDKEQVIEACLAHKKTWCKSCV